ncbi:cytochrome c biogenesis CcdA family protein [Shinella sumterensis]|uniref:Cytochrome c biogenesis protein CcdA n=1 Tax=Rhizobium subbaraonis TaxID=908946 RepID=A0A285USP7_9HYPH|nr:cytochrome c biogenesis CcdA family protein [Rhizobium subbaraonis]WLS08778.1 cytochrome c biogenesis CcdA family protein [Shinella sumterensis]SOC44829.1 cytochrome c biogenesis protein CcdA [Rhizobium subbaraonis]
MAIDVSAVGLVTAIAAGAISFVSPCVLPLVPGYLSFVSSGVDPASRHLSDRLKVVRSALFFIAGFSTVFVLLGLGAQAFGGILLRYNVEANLLGGALLVCFGFVMTGLVKLPGLLSDFRLPGPRTVSGPAGAYTLGLTFAFGWTPCIGPVLGSILTLAAMSAGSGAVLLAAYSAGLGIPFLTLAVAFSSLAAGFKRIRYAGHLLNVLAGGIMIIMGILMMTGRLTMIAFWLLERFPGLGYIG